MKVNKKLTSFTCRQCSCPAVNVFEETKIHLNNNAVTKDCNVVLPRLDTSVFNITDLLKLTSKYSTGHKGKDEGVKILSEIAGKEMERKRKCSMVENVSNGKQLNKEIVEDERKSEDTELSSKNTPCEKSLLKKNNLKQVAKKVRFKIPIAKYRIIKPMKKKITRKLLIMLTRCDDLYKRKLRSDI